MQPALSPARERLQQLLRSRGRRTGSEIVAQTLQGLGITHVYGVGGVPVDATLAACATGGMRVIGARHQQGAVLMSLAHNYVSGGLRSAVIVSAGPAVTNCATGILFGNENRWPVLVIGGRRGLSTPGSFQAFDGAMLFAPIAKWTAVVDSADQLNATLAQAAFAATDGPHGPVYLDITEEALAGYAEFTPPPSARNPPLQAPLSSTNASLREAVALLSQARRPAMLIGKGARWSEPSALLRRLADEYTIPFATSPMGRGLLPDDHALCFSAIRGRMLAEADVVLAIGMRFDWTFRFGTEISTLARIIRVDVDPIEAAGVLGRGVGLQGDAYLVLQHLLAGLDCKAASRGVERDRGWLDDLTTRRAALTLWTVPSAELGLQPMSPYEWLAELSVVMPEDAITVLDGSIVMTAAQRMLPVRHPVGRLGPGTNGCMGMGIPFAIGAKLARPDLPVVAIVGDFAFGLSSVELETAVRHRVPIVVVVANNAGPGGATRQRQFFPPDHPERVLQYGPGIRYDLTMASFGGLGCRIDSPGQIGTALSDAIASEAPVCIDVVTNENTALTAAV